MVYMIVWQLIVISPSLLPFLGSLKSHLLLSTIALSFFVSQSVNHSLSIPSLSLNPSHLYRISAALQLLYNLSIRNPDPLSQLYLSIPIYR